MTTTTIPANMLNAGDQLLGDTESYSLGTDQPLEVKRIERIPADRYSADPDGEGSLLLHFGPGHHLGIDYHAEVQIIS